MPTIGDIIDRLHREWLYPPEDQPVTTILSASIAAGDSTLTYDDTYIFPEEEDLFGPGVVLELVDGDDTELVVAGDVDHSTNTVSDLRRGIRGTTDGSHASGTEVHISPTWSRPMVFEAIADTIVDCFPPLFTTSTVTETTTSNYVSAPADAVGVQQAILETGSDPDYVRVPVQLVHGFTPATNDIGTFFPGVSSGETVYTTYRLKPTRPSLESDTLADVNADDSWERLIVIGSLAYLLSGRDVDEETIEYITERLEQETRQNTSLSLSQRLLRYYSYLRNQARRQQLATWPVTTTRNGVVLP